MKANKANQGTRVKSNQVKRRPVLYGLWPGGSGTHALDLTSHLVLRDLFIHYLTSVPVPYR